MKTILVLSVLAFLASCSSATSKMNQASSDVSYGAGAVENVSNTIDRTIATEKRIENTWTKK
ncbi:MAG: hypothetical protein ACJ76H_15370 [Bacteriovoracaceae bacterium]